MHKNGFIGGARSLASILKIANASIEEHERESRQKAAREAAKEAREAAKEAAELEKERAEQLQLLKEEKRKLK